MSMQSNTLGKFVPFQERIPLWLTGPTVVEQMVPEHLVLVMHGTDHLGSTGRWAAQLVSVCPPEDREELCRMLNSMSPTPFMVDYAKELDLDRFLNRMVTPALICAVNSWVRDVDAARTAQGRPTWREGGAASIGHPSILW